MTFACFAVLAGGVQQASAKTSPDDKVAYTVKVNSKVYGNSQATRQIASGQTDDYTWKTTPPGGAVSLPGQCASGHDWPLDENGALLRQTRVRLAPVVDASGTANVQLSFDALTPQASPKQDNASGACPPVTASSDVVRFSLALNSKPKTLTLKDGTQVTVSAKP
ncbi:hypothetical protein D7S86_14385 [Pararobbsia silviterrae]|uniref:Uncharacterized protein n=2 Tax=Pararobbsia silviterrae TaxID=1792498 RepID=A0A494XW72_9BURK|nr:hypothetical protein D7S86_14385 [Pararobbsia silviterrae]